jgi:hypothetical protein
MFAIVTTHWWGPALKASRTLPATSVPKAQKPRIETLK